MKRLTTIAAAVLVTFVAMAQSDGLWLRYARISPDGSRIAFTYKGDIYIVNASGGAATQLTTQAAHDTRPVWSPDGTKIAFASDRKGGMDIYVMPATGGMPQQLTFNSAAETPWSFSPDGQYIYFSAAIQDPASSMLFPSARLTELYKVPVAGGKTTRVLASPAEWVQWSADGKSMLYQDRYGIEDEWRKHHVSSTTRDLWRYDTATGRHTNLTARAGEDRNPVWSPDGKSMLFLSERDGGTMNVYTMPVDGGKATALTSFKKHPVRFLSVASTGTMCYTWDGAIYTQAPNGQPHRIAVTLTHDDSDQVTRLSFSKGAGDATVSPDGKMVAFVVRGDVFVTSVEYGTTKQVSNTPEAEADPTWGADSRSLVYASERGGNWQLVRATISRDGDPNFANATVINEEILAPNNRVERMMPRFNAAGTELAFIQDRNKLMVMDMKSKKVREVTDGSTWYETNGGFNYAWSPDGEWFALEYIANGRDPYTDIGIVRASGGEITNITGSGYFSENPQWVMGGKGILFTSNRYGMRAHGSWGSQDDVLLCFINRDAYDRYRLNKEDYELLKELEKEQKKNADKKKDGDKKDKKDEKTDADDDPLLKVELDGIDERVVRLTPNSSDIAGAMITTDGETLYYLSHIEKGYDLWKLDLRKHETKLAGKMGAGRAKIVSAVKDDKNLFILGSNTMQKLTISGDKLTGISFTARMKMDLAAEREAMFNHVARQIDKRFYNLNYHGINWQDMVEDYRKFLPHINNNYDFTEMLSELLGELNASHTGSRYYPSGGEATADLGVIFDWNYTGNGLRVEEVLERGPLGYAGSEVKRGTIIERINGETITPENDYSLLLNGQAGRKVLLDLRDPATGKQWQEVVKPITKSALNDLLYRRWVDRNAHIVDSLSGGRLGYVHLRSMADASYREVYSQIMGKYYKRDGIVIDTRWNGGGRLHEDIEVLFSGEKYFTQVIRGREACDMPSRRWNKPSIMLQCEANYSNAHGTPWVYKHRGIGRLVGMPVPGTMTSVSWEDLQDDSMLFGIPIIGYQLPDGSYLENTQLEPDVKVANDPATVVNGVDDQLTTAVRELLKEIDR